MPGAQDQGRTCVRWLCFVSSLVVGTGLGAAPPRPSQDADQHVVAQRVPSAFADLELAPIETRENGEVVLRVTIRPHDGIHIYAPGQRGYYPISLTFEGRSGIKAGALELPAAEPYEFKPTGERFLVYVRPFTAVQHATLVAGGAAARSGRIPATLQYQACDEVVCFKPETVSLEWTRDGAPGRRKAKVGP